MRRLSDIENETDENLPKNEDIQLPTGKVVRIRRRHLDPNSKDPLWSQFRRKSVRSKEIPRTFVLPVPWYSSLAHLPL